MAETKQRLDKVDKIKAALITQKVLAKKTGINEVRLSRCLNRELDFTPLEIVNIAKILRLNL